MGGVESLRGDCVGSVHLLSLYVLVYLEEGDHARLGECENLLQTGANPNSRYLIIISTPHIILIRHKFLRGVKNRPQILIHPTKIGPHKQHSKFLT